MWGAANELGRGNRLFSGPLLYSEPLGAISFGGSIVESLAIMLLARDLNYLKFRVKNFLLKNFALKNFVIQFFRKEIS